jgi:hypothetical protein
MTGEPLSAASMLSPSRSDRAFAFGGALAFDLQGDHASCDDQPRWSPRRTLVFIVLSSSLLWWGILQAVHAFR